MIGKHRLTRDKREREREDHGSFVVEIFSRTVFRFVRVEKNGTELRTRLINNLLCFLCRTERFDFVPRLFPFSFRSGYWPRRDSEKPRGKILILGILFSVGTTPKGYSTNNFEENFS